ncbi:Armadillo repeat-containing protein 3 [Phytophthora ramorum]
MEFVAGAVGIVAGAVVPGGGSVVDALLKIYQLCNEMKEGQETCKRVHLRLKDIFDELQKMEERGELPPSDKVAKYVGVVSKFLVHLERYRGQKLYKRLIKHQAMIREIGLIYEEIDMLFRMLNLAGTAAMMGWKQQWENDQRLQQDAMSRMVVNSGEVLKELQDTRAQLEAMMMLKYEMEQRSDQQSKETMHLLKSMMVTVVRASKATVENLPSWYFPPDEIEFEKDPFARGSFASVHRGLWGTGTKVVVKCFLVDDMVADERAKQKIESEMNLWYSFNHPNIIKMFGASHVSSPPFIVCEDATNGDLSSYLLRANNKQHMWRLLFGAAQGLSYIHKKKVVHGDLKLNNILVGADGHAKLSDFGLSAVRTSATMSKTAGNSSDGSGGLRWRAPECLSSRATFASDVYSFAMCIMEAVLDEPPFAFLSDQDVRENIRNGKIPGRPEGMSDAVWELVLLMTKKEPAERISLHQVLEKMKVVADAEAYTHPSVQISSCKDCGMPTADGASMCSNCSFATQASDVRIKLSAPPASIFQSSTSEEAGSDMADLLRAVESANGDEKERALLFVVQNCTNDKWRQLLYEANGVKLLSDLVRNGRTHFTQLYALECLHWASSSDAKVATSDVDALRDCVKEVTPQELVAVIDALKNSSDDGNEEGVIRCASIAAKGNNDDLGDSGTVDSDNETQKLWSGLVQPLAMLLQNGNDTQKLWTAEAMGNLALNNESIRSEIARKDAIRHLVALVQVGTSEQKHRAAYALGNLALSNDALGMIVRKGAIKALVTLMRGGTAQQKNGAAYALEIIMRCGYVNLSDIARETSVDPLVAILLVGNDEQKESAVTVLANLARNDKQCAEIASQGAISPLVTILQYGTEEQKQRAAVVLAGLARREEHCEEIAREGAIKPLVVLLQSESDDQKLSAAVVLAGCSNSDANCDEIAREGAITPLLGLLRRGTEKQKESAAVVLASLAYGDSHRHAIARAGGIDPLVRLLSNGTDRQKYSGALALGNLASNDGSRGEIGRGGAIEPLIVLLQEGTDKQKSVAAFALGSLAWHNDHNRVEIADKGGIPHLVTLLDRGTEDQQYYATGAIGNLASNAAVRLKVTHAECITLLVALVRDGSPRQKCAAALALGNLSSDIGANREKIARAGGVAPLVQLVESGTTDQKCYAALALANLATKNEANRAELARIGAKAPLLILAQSGTPDQKVYASKAAKKLSDAKVRKANLQVRVFNTFMRK